MLFPFPPQVSKCAPKKFRTTDLGGSLSVHRLCDSERECKKNSLRLLRSHLAEGRCGAESHLDLDGGVAEMV